MNLFQNINRDKILLATLMLGLFLRGLNPTFGSPALYALNDEAVAHQSALYMLANKTPFSIATYTPLNAYLQIPFIIMFYLVVRLLGLFSSASEFEYFLLTHEGYLLFIPRLISAAFGALTIIVIYKISLRLFKSRHVALISAFLTACSFNLVHISHFGKPWAGAIFFFALSALFFLKKRVLFTSLFGALSFGFHQIGIFSFPFILFLQASSIKKKIFACILWIFLVVFFQFLSSDVNTMNKITTGYSFFKPNTVITDILANNISFNSVLITVKNNSFIYIFKNLLATDGVIFIFGIAGFSLLIRKMQYRSYLGFALFQFVFSIFFLWLLVRYYFPFLILIIPLASYAIYKTGNAIKFFKLPFAFLIVFFLLLNPLWWNYLFMKEPTFLQVHKWIDQNLPHGEWFVYAGGRYQTFSPSAEASAIAQKYDPSFYKRLAERASAKKNLYTKNVVYLGRIPGDSKKGKFENFPKQVSFDFVVDYYLYSGDSLNKMYPGKFEVVKSFKSVKNLTAKNMPEPLFDASSNFQTFHESIKGSMFDMERIGPNFDVLKVNKDE